MNKQAQHDWVRRKDEPIDIRTCAKCGKRSAFYMHDKSICKPLIRRW